MFTEFNALFNPMLIEIHKYHNENDGWASVKILG